MALKYGYSSKRDKSGKTTYTDKSGKSVSSKEATGKSDKSSGSGSRSAEERAKLQEQYVSEGYTSVEAAAKASGVPVSESIKSQRTGRAAASTATYRGQVQGKVYSNLTEKEILENKLSSTTAAVLQSNETALRQAQSQQQQKEFALRQRYESGKVLTPDEITSLTGKSDISLDIVSDMASKQKPPVMAKNYTTAFPAEIASSSDISMNVSPAPNNPFFNSKFDDAINSYGKSKFSQPYVDTRRSPTYDAYARALGTLVYTGAKDVVIGGKQVTERSIALGSTIGVVSMAKFQGKSVLLKYPKAPISDQEIAFASAVALGGVSSIAPKLTTLALSSYSIKPAAEFAVTRDPIKFAEATVGISPGAFSATKIVSNKYFVSNTVKNIKTFATKEYTVSELIGLGKIKRNIFNENYITVPYKDVTYKDVIVKDVTSGIFSNKKARVGSSPFSKVQKRRISYGQTPNKQSFVRKGQDNTLIQKVSPREKNVAQFSRNELNQLGVTVKNLRVIDKSALGKVYSTKEFTFSQNKISDRGIEISVVQKGAAFTPGRNKFVRPTSQVRTIKSFDFNREMPFQVSDLIQKQPVLSKFDFSKRPKLYTKQEFFFRNNQVAIGQNVVNMKQSSASINIPKNSQVLEQRTFNPRQRVIDQIKAKALAKQKLKEPQLNYPKQRQDLVVTKKEFTLPKKAQEFAPQNKPLKVEIISQGETFLFRKSAEYVPPAPTQTFSIGKSQFLVKKASKFNRNGILYNTNSIFSQAKGEKMLSGRFAALLLKRKQDEELESTIQNSIATDIVSDIALNNTQVLTPEKKIPNKKIEDPIIDLVIIPPYGPRIPGVPDKPGKVPELISPPIPIIGTGKRPPEEPVIPKMPFNFNFDLAPKKEKVSGGFVAVVGKKNKRVSEYATTYETAFNQGARYTDNSPDASFNVIKVTEKAKTGNSLSDINPILEERFRSPKSKNFPRRFVEKNKYRINSPGEVTGISKKSKISLKGFTL